jgi:4-hydroxy-2-oxoheptanedioate aldolase
MIETKEAVDNIDLIAGVEELDAIFVGSGDLRLSLTGSISPGSGKDEMDEALSLILASCKKHNLVPGIFSTSVADATAMIAKGFQFITLKSDSMILSEYATQLVSEVRTSLPANTHEPK